MSLVAQQQIEQIVNETKLLNSSSYWDDKKELRFRPPVYRTRYCVISDLLERDHWKTELERFVEFGSAELKIFIYLKHLPGIRELNFVDINRDLLEDNCFQIRPLIVDYMRKRANPLIVNLFVGTIEHPDDRIVGADVVIAIELIEHLYPDVLEAVPHTIFHCIRPKLALLSTPNADFNIVLPNLQGFRHWDHKFEWTREQFESWARNITTRYPEYCVTFIGIGSGPDNRDDVGCCSQMAIFVRKDVVDRAFELPRRSRLESYGICKYFSCSPKFETSTAEDTSCYKLLKSIEYPWETT